MLRRDDLITHWQQCKPAPQSWLGAPQGGVVAAGGRRCATLNHAFWPDDVSLRSDDCVDFSRVQGHNQITDLYLLALAVAHGGRLVTFDQVIALSSVYGATADHLLLL